jgi:hypothetical protein
MPVAAENVIPSLLANRQITFIIIIITGKLPMEHSLFYAIFPDFFVLGLFPRSA